MTHSLTCHNCLWTIHTHTHRVHEGGGLLVTVWLSAKKNILENNSCKRGKWWEGSALRVWKVKRRKKKSRVHAELEDESPALIPRTSTGKNGNVTCEFVWGWGGDLREGRRTDPLFWTLYKPRGGAIWFSCVNGWWWHRIWASPTSRRRSDARARKVTFNVPPPAGLRTATGQQLDDW